MQKYVPFACIFVLRKCLVTVKKFDKCLFIGWNFVVFTLFIKRTIKISANIYIIYLVFVCVCVCIYIYIFPLYVYIYICLV